MVGEREILKEKIAAMTDEQFLWFINQAQHLLSESISEPDRRTDDRQVPSSHAFPR